MVASGRWLRSHQTARRNVKFIEAERDDQSRHRPGGSGPPALNHPTGVWMCTQHKTLSFCAPGADERADRGGGSDGRGDAPDGRNFLGNLPRRMVGLGQVLHANRLKRLVVA